MKSRFLFDKGATLLANGYEIIPILPGEKRPGIKDWQNAPSTPAQLQKWLSNGHADSGVGVRCHWTPVIDIDVQDAEAVEAIKRIVQEEITGFIPERIGRAPKSMLVFKTDVPFTKVMTPFYISPDGATHRTEVLGSGQQFVAEAIHPDTDAPYDWGPLDLTDVPREMLPSLYVDTARRICARVEAEVFIPLGWTRKGVGADGDARTDTPDALAFAVPPADISVERFVRLLTVQDPDDYHNWIRVGMVCYHQFNGEAEGLDIWRDWSMTSANYTDDCCDDRWSGLDTELRRQPVTARSLIREYTEQARVEPGRMAGLNLEAFLDRYVYVERGDKVCDLTKPPRMWMTKFSEFERRVLPAQMDIPAPTQAEPDRTKRVAISKIWMMHPERKDAEGSMFNPNMPALITDDDGFTWINTFSLPNHRETTDTHLLQPLFDHMDYMFPQPQERKFFWQWLAFSLQRPGTRCKVTPLHISEHHGTGRGFLVELIDALVGTRLVKKTTIAELADGQFHDYLYEALFTIIEEARDSDTRFGVDDKIRSKLTDNTQYLNLKYGESGTFPVFSNVFMMSNNADALIIPVKDRRIQVLEGPKEKIGAGDGDCPIYEAYYDRLYGMLRLSEEVPNKEAIAQVFWYLMRMDISDFQWKHSTDTPAKMRMIYQHQTETEALFMEMLAGRPAPVATREQITSYMAALSGGSLMDHDIQQGQVTALLKKTGENVQRVRWNGQRPRPWSFVKGVEMTDQEIIAGCDKMQAAIEALVNN